MSEWYENTFVSKVVNPKSLLGFVTIQSILYLILHLLTLSFFRQVLTSFARLRRKDMRIGYIGNSVIVRTIMVKLFIL